MVFWGRPLRLCCALILCFLRGHVAADSIITTVGSDVTLICKYDIGSYGRLSVCWGRGSLPNRGCGNEVIKSDGTAVSSRQSERYLLQGDLGAGDVSLTIRGTEEADSGTYGCRVDIPGWFNDHKHHMTLTVVPGRPSPLTVEQREVRERSLVVQWTPGFDGGRPIVSYRLDLKSKEASWDAAVVTQVLNPKLTQLTLVDLRPARTYTLRVFATNEVGTSRASNVLTVTTKEAAPEGPPLDVKLESLTARSIRVTWKPPKSDLTNGVLRGYTLSFRSHDPVNGTFGRWYSITLSSTPAEESFVLSQLKPSTHYGVLVQARTNAGIGPPSETPFCSTLDEPPATSAPAPTWTPGTTRFDRLETSATSAPVTAATVWGDSEPTSGVTSEHHLGLPDPPVVELKEVKDNTFSLVWTTQGDGPLTGFILEYKAVNASWDSTTAVVDYGPDQRESTILEMKPSTYNLRMFARNRLGTSKASNILTITTTETGLHMDNFVTTVSSDTHAAASVEESQKGHLAAVLVPVVLLLVIVATLTTWKLRRMKWKNGGLNVWLTRGALRYRGTEPLQEM